MKRNTILKILADNQAEIKSLFNIASMSLFGSAVRNKAGSESDLDFLVSFRKIPGIFGFLELKFYFEDLFQCPVDLVTHKGVKKQLANQIFQETFHAL